MLLVNAKLQQDTMFVLILAANLIIGASAIITAFPTNKVAVAGSEIILECRTNTSRNLPWRQQLLNATEKDDPVDVIYTGNKFSKQAVERYEIIRESYGQFDLKFNATLNHGNEYMCVEPGGDNFSSQLIVLASEPKCYVNGMQMTSNLIVVDDDEYVELKCNLTFAGRWNPSMEWTQQINSENDYAVVDTQDETEKRGNICFTSSTLVLNATYNETSFMCKTRFLESNRPKTTSAENIPEYSHNWTSPTFVLRSFYESKYVDKENGYKDGSMHMKGLLILVVTALVTSALLCVVVIIMVKLSKTKAQQLAIYNPAHPTANPPPQPATNHLLHSGTNHLPQLGTRHPDHTATKSLAVTGIQQQVIYSNVEKNPVKSQQDLSTNHLECVFQEPVIYSEVYKPGMTQTGDASAQQLSIQSENSCKVTGADGTEYALLPVFQSKQPFPQTKARQEIFETSVYAPIDHTIVPHPPTSNPWKHGDS